MSLFAFTTRFILAGFLTDKPVFRVSVEPHASFLDSNCRVVSCLSCAVALSLTSSLARLPLAAPIPRHKRAAAAVAWKLDRELT